MSSSPVDRPRYYAFSRYLRQRFGCRVRKITVHAGFTCPNRDGSRGWGGCTFCNNAGFSPNARVEAGSIRRQIAEGIVETRRRGKGDRFIVYFQPYSNTYASVDRLREVYEASWHFPEVVGMSIGTRPDCVDAEKIDLIAEHASRGEVWLEYGLQSIHDHTLAVINRCHSYREFLDAIELTRNRGIRICVHTILGLPGETREMMLATHRRLGELPIDGVKIHVLHVMRDTMMAEHYRRGEVLLLSRKEFVGLVCDMLEVLPPTVVIQRLHASAAADVLVAPPWCLDKARVLNEIRDEFIRRDSWQGKALGCEWSDLPLSESSLASSVEAGGAPKRGSGDADSTSVR